MWGMQMSYVFLTSAGNLVVTKNFHLGDKINTRIDLFSDADKYYVTLIEGDEILKTPDADKRSLLIKEILAEVHRRVLLGQKHFDFRNYPDNLDNVPEGISLDLPKELWNKDPELAQEIVRHLSRSGRLK